MALRRVTFVLLTNCALVVALGRPGRATKQSALTAGHVAAPSQPKCLARRKSVASAPTRFATSSGGTSLAETGGPARPSDSDLDLLQRMLDETCYEARGNQLFNTRFCNSPFLLPWKGLQWAKVLGSGADAKVFAVRFKDKIRGVAANAFALKVSKKSRTLLDPCITRAFAGMPNKTAPPVLRVLDVRRAHDRSFILMQRADMDLWDWNWQACVSRRSDVLGLKFKFFHQALVGLQRMHLLGFAHCDLKGENVALRIRDEQAYIIDYDMMQHIDDDTANGRGTRGFRSPSFLETQVCRRETDVWAAGVILYQLLFQEDPYESGSSEPAELESARAFAGAVWATFSRVRERLRQKVRELVEAKGVRDNIEQIFLALFHKNVSTRTLRFGRVVVRLAGEVAEALGRKPSEEDAAPDEWQRIADAVAQRSNAPRPGTIRSTGDVEGVRQCLRDAAECESAAGARAESEFP